MSFTKISDVVYHESESKKLLLDLYVPSILSLLGSITNQSIDLIIFFYGGGLETGSKEDLEHLAKEFASSGAIFVAPNYSLYPHAKYPDFINDGAKAISWLKENISRYLPREISKTKVRFFVGGHSAGGYITLMLALNPSYLAGEGIHHDDISGFIAASGQPTAHFNVLKYRRDNSDSEIIDDSSPIYYAEHFQGETPLLIVCSKNDIPRRFEQTELLKSKLDKCYKGKIEYQILNHHDHSSYMTPKPGRINSDIFVLSQNFIKNTK